MPLKDGERWRARGLCWEVSENDNEWVMSIRYLSFLSMWVEHRRS